MMARMAYHSLSTLGIQTHSMPDQSLVSCSHRTRALHTSGTATSVGPIWSFATDGDATRCAAGHKLFIKAPLSEDSPLYRFAHQPHGAEPVTGDGKSHLISTINTYSSEFARLYGLQPGLSLIMDESSIRWSCCITLCGCRLMMKRLSSSSCTQMTLKMSLALWS
ncbi:hypothetical protein EV702DRAFT_1279051 [Suillus placidus]|uniref:Uncharacterized protein n=1 Tax=Suillus placidus TaxID=48579 RepID=A0A9P6ZU60_9AGAM|nr:hypothetical protein EV702DRAFT_1279051 [Suillus placidus]